MAPESSGVGEFMDSPAVQAVAHLVVVLEVVHEPFRRLVQGRGPAALLLPGVVLPLIQKAPLGGRDELLGSAPMVRVIGLGAAG